MADQIESPKKPKSKEIEALGVTLGVDSNLAFTMPFRPVGMGLHKTPDEELHEIASEQYDEGPTVRQLIVMRKLDGQARALYQLLKLPILAALTDATFIPADGGEKEAEYITDVFELPPSQGGMTVTFHRFMEHLLGALFEGFSAFEKVFWIPEYGPLDGKITLKKLAYRPSTTVTFIADKHGGYAGIRQRSNFAGKVIDVYLDPDYSFYFAAQETERKFYGVSFFQSAFPHYDAKVRLYYTAHLASQRAAVGTRVGTVPPNAGKDTKREFQQSLSNLSAAQWMMMPEGFKVEVLREGGSFDFLGLINHHNHMMAQSVLAGFFDSDTGGGQNESGSLVSFAKPGDDMFILMLRSIMDDIANQINHYIIPQLIDFNFPGSKYPTFTWGKLTDEQKEAVAGTFDKLITSGSSYLGAEEFLRELEKSVAEEMGLEIDWDEVEKREAEDKAKQEAMEMGLPLPGTPGAIDPETGLPIPGGPGAIGPDGMPLPPIGPDGQPLDPIPPGAEDEVESLDDVVALLMAKAEMDAGVAEVEGAAGAPAAPGAKKPPVPGAPAVPGQPPAAGGLPASAAKAPATPGQALVKAKGKKKKPGAVGLTADMIDWADRMVVLAGRDYRDG